MKPSKPVRLITRILLSAFFLAAASGLGYAFRALGFPETNIVLAYFLAVVMTAWLTEGYLFGVLASIAATFIFNYLFTVPLFTFAVDDPSYLVTFGIMTVTALITSMLTSHAKRSAQEATAREADTKAVYDLMTQLADAKGSEEMARAAIQAVSARFHCRAAFQFLDAEGAPEEWFIQQLADDQQVRRRAAGPQATAAQLSALEKGPIRANEFCVYPIRGSSALLGLMLLPTETSDACDASQLRQLDLMNETLAMALDRLNAMEQRIRSQEEAERERYRGNLLRAISHDLRTPLMGIMGTSEMLMDMTGPEDPRYAMSEGIYHDADWLHSLVENILSLTRLQEGRLVLRKTPEAMEEVVGCAVDHFSKRAAGREIAVSVPEELLMVPMDAKLISQVLINLLDNALKHTSPDQEISVTVTAEPGSARVCVADRGTGIRKEDLPRVFETFYTTDSPHAESVQGIGLGLSICAAIIRAHGGEIKAANRTDGPGAEICFTLPLAGEEKENGVCER